MYQFWYKFKYSLIVLVTAILAGMLGLFFLSKDKTAIKEVTATNIVPLPTLDSPIFTSVSISPVSPPSSNTHNFDPDKLQQLFAQGLTLFEAKKYEETIEHANNILAQGGNVAAIYDLRGSAFFALKDYENALSDYSQAIQSDVLFARAYYNRGRLHKLMKQYDEAISDLEKSAELEPAEFTYRANGNIGLIYHQQGEYDKALEAFAAAISFDDSKADTYFHRGETYTAMGNFEAAISDYEAAISRFANYTEAYQSLGYARYKTSQFDQALAALNKAIELSPGNPTPYFYRMLVYLATNQTDKTQAEVTQGMDTISALAEEEQGLLFKRILDDLETFAQENPAQTKAVEALVNLIPPQ